MLDIPASISCIVLTNGVPIPLLIVTVYVPLSLNVKSAIDNDSAFVINLPPVVIVLLSGPVQVTVGVGLPFILVNNDTVTKLPDGINLISSIIGVPSAVSV